MNEFHKLQPDIQVGASDADAFAVNVMSPGFEAVFNVFQSLGRILS